MSTNQPREPRPRFNRRLLLRYASMGLELASAIVGLTLAGLWIDFTFDTRPVGIIVGAALGIVGGFYNFLREAWRVSRADSSRDEKGPISTKNDDRG